MSDTPEVDPLAVCAMPTRCLASLHGRDRRRLGGARMIVDQSTTFETIHEMEHP
jgi:hypothetical protein